MKKLSFLFLLIAIVSTNVSAEPPSYNYFSFGYAYWDMDDADEYNPRGLEFDGSRTITDSLYVAGDFTRVSGHNNSTNIATLGLGYFHDFSENSSFFFEADIANIEPEHLSNETGFELSAGIRSMLSENIEMKAAVEHLDIEHDEFTVYVVGGMYKFSETNGIYFDYKHEPDFQQFIIGLRREF